MNEAEPTPGKETQEERVLCTVCLHPNNTRADYCSKCGAPINTLLTFAPYDHILCEGFVYRRAVDGPASRTVLIGMWVLFGPSLIGAPLAIASGFEGNSDTDLFAISFGVIYLVISAVILYRTTANYLAKRQTS